MSNANARIDGRHRRRARSLLPGLIDAHGHVMDLGFAALSPRSDGYEVDRRSCSKRLRRLPHAAGHPDAAKWLQGFRAGTRNRAGREALSNRRPTWTPPSTYRPVVLERVDGHAVVANSAAMRAAGVTASTRAPPAGEARNIHRRPVFLVDTAASELIDKVIPGAPRARQISTRPLPRRSTFCSDYGRSPPSAR